MRLLKISILFFWISALSAQVSLSDMASFHSAPQEAAFTKMQTGDTALLELLVFANKEATRADYEKYQARLVKIAEALDSAKLVRKSPKKQIKKIFNAVHDNLLVKYEFENSFCEVFTTGFYNCVSATALYSYMLEAMGIENVLVETPDHVYAMALIEDEEWVLESTLPEQGYYPVSDDDYQTSLDALVAQKLITLEQRNSANIDSLVSEMFPRRAISSKRLVAIQYTNMAHYYFEDKNYEQALQNAVWAQMISSDEINSELLYSCLAFWIDNNPFEAPSYFKNLQYLASLDTSKAAQSNMLEVLAYYGNSFVNDSLNEVQFINYSQALSAGIAQTGADTTKVYALTRGILAQKAVVNLNGLLALKYGKQSLKSDSTLTDVFNYLITGIGLLERGQVLPRAQILDTALAYYAEFVALKKKPLWNSLISEIYLLAMIDELELGSLKSAVAYQKQFEAFAEDELRNTQLNLQYVEVYYKKLALKCYNSSRSQAKMALEKGLEYAPNSRQLRQTRKILGL
jgi:hypothetical protein